MNQRMKACKVKRFLTEAEAKAECQRLWYFKQLGTYKCRYCHGWHMYTVKPDRIKFLFEQLERDQ